jgi:hypothetical protein
MFAAMGLSYAIFKKVSMGKTAIFGPRRERIARLFQRVSAIFSAHCLS